MVDYESLSSGYRETCMHWNRRSSITPLFFFNALRAGYYTDRVFILFPLLHICFIYFWRGRSGNLVGIDTIVCFFYLFLGAGTNGLAFYVFIFVGVGLRFVLICNGRQAG